MPFFMHKQNKIFVQKDDTVSLGLDEDNNTDTNQQEEYLQTSSKATIYDDDDDADDDVFIDNESLHRNIGSNSEEEEEEERDLADENHGKHQQNKQTIMTEKINTPRNDSSKKPLPRKKKYWKFLKNTIHFQLALNNRRIFATVEKSITNFDPMRYFQCLLEKPKNSTELNESKILQDRLETRTERCSDNEYLVRSDILLDYFIKISEVSDDAEKLVSFDYVRTLLRNGADINAVDKHGQGVLHEVARIWHVDVAKFLILHGANVNHPDDYGRTPLHVACTVNYIEMVRFLLDSGAEINKKTFGEEQTVLHYAAKNDSVDTMKLLFTCGVDINAEDYMGRTPLQVAAEHDRRDAAKALINAGCDVGRYDDNMTAIIVVLIKKMPNIALLALDKFHQKCKTSRREYFYLNHLTPPTDRDNTFEKSPLQVAVEGKHMNVLMHPIFRRLIDVKWKNLGRWGACIYFAVNMLLTLLWTFPLGFEAYYIQADEEDWYWSIVYIITIVFCFLSELREFMQSHKKSHLYRDWRTSQLHRDKAYAHPRWPQENVFLEREIGRVKEDEKTSYLQDMWNYFDVVTYSAMLTTLVTKLIDQEIESDFTERLERGSAAVTIIFLWLRMLKYSRPFKTLGPFIAILNHVVIDTSLIIYLALHIFVPSVASFWIVFGAQGIDTYGWLDASIFYNVFLMSVGGSYQTNKISDRYPYIARFLLFFCILLGSVICMNLYIALMSNTFQRVYDNLCANALFQRATAILDMEADLSSSYLKKQREWVIENCSPDSLFYIDETGESEDGNLERMTLQIKSKTDEILNVMTNGNDLGSKNSNKKKTSGKDDSPNYHYDIKERQARNPNDPEIVKLAKAVENIQMEYRESIAQTREDITALSTMLKQFIVESKQRESSRRARELQGLLNESMKKH